MGVHIDKRVAIGTRSANQNPESRRICRGVPIETRPYKYSISFPGDLIRDTALAQRQIRLCIEISLHNIEFGNKKEYLSGMNGQFMVCFNVSAWPDV